MGAKQSVPQASEAFMGRMPKFPSLSEDVPTKREFEEGVVILDTIRSYGNTSRASFMEIENNDSARFMMARAEADRIAEAESLRLATEQSIRVNDEGSLIYQGSIRSILSRKDSNISKQLSYSRSNTMLTKQSKNNSILSPNASAENLGHMASNLNNNYYNNSNESEDNSSAPQFFDMLNNKCGPVFSECHRYPQSELEKLRNINNCDSEMVVNKTAENCGCLGPRHDRLNCPICRGMHLEDAPLLY
ncbi:hypothetical protein FG386_000992 [Cryptosporidium ryanae]|uniref:uncharacterized protein n=1 Tax=Cryptosporidium ryanae TaxID=515981 RepID=UPI00351A70B6|nr:hypothetical protein FG386_000992 [Cryptosporidium ryanae]